jgi:molecular chaperone HscA
MALLQISEPGMAPAPHQRRLAVGIDLGTTNSLVASVRNSVAEVLTDEDGQALLPSAVRYLAAGRTEIGAKALAARAEDPFNTVVSVKRLMGRGLADVTRLYGEALQYQFVDTPGMVQLKTRAGTKSPVEVSAEILATLRQRAEDSLGDELVGAVITVPAYFDDAQRQATKDAAQLAGLNVLRLLNEPTAAALAYGLDNSAEGVYAVYDLGGGTFDISILKLSRGIFEVLATGGDSALGGDDFDEVLAGLAESAAGSKTATPGERAQLLSAARAAKHRLSNEIETSLSFIASGREISASVTRAAFEGATAALVARTLTAVRRALRDARLDGGAVKGVVMVGGATRMPQVRAAVAELFGTDPLIGIDPDQVVALGAALQANLLAGNRGSGEDWLLLDVIPLSLGVETMGGLAERIIPRNSTIPIARAQDFTTYKDGQSAMAIHVVQGERELVSDCRSLARFELRGIPPMAAGAARIRVTYQVDADGLLSVEAREMISGVEASIMVKPSYGLSDEEVAKMLEDSFGHAADDMHVRALREQQVDAERLMLATRSALAADGDLLSEAETAELLGLIDALEAIYKSGDTEAIRLATEALGAGSEEFAARRMDRGIQRALAGKRLDEIA